MKKKYYHQKLIRDRIPEVIKATGDEGKTRILGEREYEKELKKKLIEESKEVLKASKEEVLNELADVLELIKSIASHYKITVLLSNDFKKMHFVDVIGNMKKTEQMQLEKLFQ